MSAAKKLALKLGVIGTGVAANASVFAADYTADLTAAQTDATTNITAVILGVVGLAALGYGVGRMLGWFK